MSSNNRVSKRRKIRHSERLQYIEDDCLYDEAKIDPLTVDGQGKVNDQDTSSSAESQSSLIVRLLQKLVFW